jgi:hypothetical protein
MPVLDHFHDVTNDVPPGKDTPMMPMLPPSHIEELARGHLDSHARLYRARHIADPDALRSAQRVPAGSVLMALRRLMTGMGLRTRLHRWLDARGDGAASGDSPPVETGGLPGARAESVPDDDAERQIAA